jgi:fatty acid synthase
MSTDTSAPSLRLNDLYRQQSDHAPALLAEAHGIAIVFGGQASDYLTALSRLYRPGTRAGEFLDGFVAQQQALLASLPMTEQMLYPHGLDFRPWLDGERPNTLSQAQLSLPLIYATQMAELLSLLEAGFDRPAFWQKIVATSGHSQGLVPALCVNETLKTGSLDERALDYAKLVFFMGLRVAQAVGSERHEQAPMASVRGYTTAELETLLGEGAYVALSNTSQSKVVSGHPHALERLRRAIGADVDSRKQRKAAGRYAGPVPDGGFEYLPVTAPFHSPLLAEAAARAARDVAGFAIDLSALPVPLVDGYNASDVRDPLHWLTRRVLVDRVEWTSVGKHLQTLGAGYVFDFGPGDTVAKLSMSNLRGRGAAVLAISIDADRKRALDSRIAPSVPRSYDVFAPKRIASGVFNRFVEATGRQPVILPGMTPTTVEAPLVVAAANAGFVAELAGGGQTTEAMLRKRLSEVQRTLAPGQGIVFNALYLDPYLWKLHFGSDLILRLRDEGFPLLGVTISAGIPPKDEAVALLRKLHAHGLWLNAFKPGNAPQLTQVLQIADACSDLTLFVHIEGGKAGGHHSWEDLDDLLTKHYAALRERSNIVLCVGGGIANEAQAAAYLSGAWSERFDLPRMPVDAVFVGTRLMATREAKTSPQVKAALVRTQGSKDWPLDGEERGGVTSGRSSLDASIYYMENAAAQTGRLLDSVAGKLEAITARKTEIIAALNRTAKPYFGDVHAMTYMELLQRFVALTAIGRGTEYEDGIWPDISYRRRFEALMGVCTARFGGGAVVAFDEPHAALRAWAEAHPEAAHTVVHPRDVRAFVSICKQPGKPVCFVPVIDADIRRWYKSDSLWQSHDDRFSANQVLSIPGPEGVTGIKRVDEPVAEVLSSFVRALHDIAVESHVDKRSPIERALACHDASVAGALVKNPLRLLFDARKGRVVSERRDAQGKLLALEAKDAGQVSARLSNQGEHLDARIVSGEHELPLELSLVGDKLVWDRPKHIAAQQTFYAAIMSSMPRPNNVEAFKLATQDDTRGGMPLNMAFALAWPEILRTLSAERPDMLALLHEENRVTAGPAWPVDANATLNVTASVERNEAVAGARRVTVAAALSANGVHAATVHSTFFIRSTAEQASRWHYATRITLRDDAERGFFESQPWLKMSGNQLPLGTLRIACEHTATSSHGEVFFEEKVVARIALTAAEAERHPVEEVCRLLATPPSEVALSEARDLGSLEISAPSDMKFYAHASGDLNPLHTHAGIAHYAGFSAPIVHGMWTASAALHRAIRLTSDGDASRLRSLQTRFVAPVALNDRLSVSVRQIAVEQGGPIVELSVESVRGEHRVLVLSGRAAFSAPRTAYAFPGQGIQAVNMGMEAYARSAAARGAWDEADRVCKEKLGFSILHIVRNNPKALLVGGETLSHPKGVLFLTQFTQVAMAVMAVAQVRELDARGVLVPNAQFCGHSVGEYSALAAIAHALPLAAVVELVYHRGLAMNGLVKRDASGASPYAMGVIRPNHAGLTEPQALAIVDRVRSETGLPLEVVNYNIRGRQYSVTGHVDALNALADTLAPLSKPSKRGTGREKAYIDVPGIDVPFHSSLLRDGVPVFRATLTRVLPQNVRPELLTQRYIPNLVAKPFSLERSFVELVQTVSGSEVLSEVLANFSNYSTEALARVLLIELLAYQFASPVRWIETQDHLLSGPNSVDLFVEVGVREQPTIANMALITMSDGNYERKARVLNSEADLAELVGPKALASAGTASAPASASAPSSTGSVPANDVVNVAVGASRSPASASAPAPDVSFSVKESLLSQLSLQAKIAPSQLRDSETLDELLGGNSARRNQVLADIGAEFAVGAIDGAHEQPISELIKSLSARAPRYSAPGKYMSAAIDHALTQTFGAVRLTRKEISDHLAQTWNLGAGRTFAILARIALHSRDGESARGGPLSALPAKGLTDRTRALAWLDEVVSAYARELGISLSKPIEHVAVKVDSAAIEALEARLLSVLTSTADHLHEALGIDTKEARTVDAPVEDTAAKRLALYEREHGPAYEAAIRPCFDAKKHVAFTSAWAWIKRDVVAFIHGAAIDEAALAARLDADALKVLSAYRALNRNVEAIDRLLALRVQRAEHKQRTALVTGAGPGSIAIEIVRLMLARGDRVIVTTSTYSRERLAFFKQLYQTSATSGAELHVVPANQASLTDMDALTRFVFDSQWTPDILLPFAAMGDAADLTQLTDRSLATLRVLLVGLERLLGNIASGYDARSIRDRLCRVILPLSPNHGAFGGDGFYAECKAALETLLTKQRSEHARWGRYVALAGARIGWVRGTGLMEANDAIAKAIEQRAGVKTFSNGEMAAKLFALIDTSENAIVDLSGGLGTVDTLGDIAREVREQLAESARSERRRNELRDALAKRLQSPRSERVAPKTRETLPVAIPSDAELATLPPLDHLDADRVVVVVGYGEVGPWGSSRTRWAMESQSKLSLEAIAELAWMMGLIEAKDDGWQDKGTGESIADEALIARYEARVLAHAGIRVIEPEITHFDPKGATQYFDVHLDRDFVFPVTTREQAEQVRAADPDNTRVIVAEDGTITVVREKGSKVRMPRALRLDRHVAGQIPSGWSAARYGIPQELVAQVDRATLFNLVATVEAFLSAGMEPEEIYAYIHPSRVGSTQSAGLGSMNQLRRMYTDFYMGTPRQNDTLQETLINVVAGYVVQSYLGSYGPMSFPVGACATAAVSVADAVDKIMGGVADLMVTGGTDDYAIEGNVGFSDMGATAASDEMAELGIEPRDQSRPNDRRRKGFVESQGSGAMVLCRASLAIDMGLPVYGIVAHASSHGDGINLSVPAPGIGVLSAAAEPAQSAALDFTARREAIAALDEAALAKVLGNAQAARMAKAEKRRLAHHYTEGMSPLRASLAVFGLQANDIAFVSKHDTSTAMNDVGENRLHHWLQEKLGRTPGLPLNVISQKSLTGHSKGAAAAWQMNGVLQAMATGILPGNKSLEDVDSAMRVYDTMVFSDSAIQVPRHELRAALVTSLGFGHIGAIVCLAHPFLFWRLLGARATAYRERLNKRLTTGHTKLRSVLSGHEPMFVRRTERPFASKDLREEAKVLMNAQARRNGEHFA